MRSTLAFRSGVKGRPAIVPSNTALPGLQVHIAAASQAASGRSTDTITDISATVSTRDERSMARQTAEAAGSILVDGVVVQPSYRSTPWEAEARHAATAQDKAVVMFVSESGICRGPLAAAAFSQLLQHSSLRDCLRVEMRSSRDYCAGQPPDSAASAAAHTLGYSLTADASAATADDSNGAAAAAAAGGGGVSVFNPLEDIVAADLVLVMDKYTAADVLREVSSYDLINPGGRYSSRVRLLGSFHPQLAAQAHIPDGQDIDDALYGNEGGMEEQAAVLDVAKVIVESCRNLLQFLEDLACANGVLSIADKTTNSSSSNGNGSSSSSRVEAAAGEGVAADGSSSNSSSQGAKFKAVLAQHVQSEGVIEWLVPPMLQGSNVDVDGWV